jgi:feruloyl-CoA synthase
MVWVDPTAAGRLFGVEGDPAGIAADDRVRAHIAEAIGRHNLDQSAATRRVARLLVLGEPPQIDANEITDKGYINQRAVLERRAEQVARLHADPPDPEVIRL